MSTRSKEVSRAVPGATSPKTLEEYAALPYRLEITPGEHGNFVVRYPDLLGCITQVERLEEAISASHEILLGWLEIALEDGLEIPLPQRTEEYSGKFMVRIPKSLHRGLAETARQENVSLNAHVTAVLAAGHVWNAADCKFNAICNRIIAIIDQLPPRFEGVPQLDLAEREAVGICLAYAA